MLSYKIKSSKEQESTGPNEAALVSKGRLGQARLSRKMWLGLFVASCVVILLVIGFVIWGNKSNQSSSGNVSKLAPVCSRQTINQAVKAIGSNDIATLEKVNSQVTSQNNYMRDSNCIYIALRYAIMAGDIKTSEKHYDQLVSLKELNRGKLAFSNLFSGQPMKLTELLSLINVLKTNRAAEGSFSRQLNSGTQAADNAYEAKHATN